MPGAYALAVHLEENRTLTEKPESAWEKSLSAGGSDESGHAWSDGVRAFCAQDYELARQKFQAAMVAKPDEGRVQVALGHSWMHSGEPDKALEHYNRAATLNHEPPDLRYNRALIRLRAGEGESAVPFLQELLENPPEVTKGRFYLGLLFPSSLDFRCDVALHLGHYFRDTGNIDRGVEHFRKAVNLVPENVTAHQRLGELLILRKEYVEAKRNLNIVLELSPLEEDKFNAHNNLGIACYENGEMDEAISHLTWVLRDSPANPAAIHNLNFIYEREGIFERSEKLPRAIRFMDVHEGALPIFDLSGGEEGEDGTAIKVVGRSNEMLRVMRHARIASASEAPILITGESGSGKELLARVINLNSARRDAPFAVVNCTSLTEMLLESELFGHTKGAFTGARAPKIGRLDQCSGGTVFLDEITALSPLLQGRLLRAIQEGEYFPIGASTAVPFAVRIIAATNRDLAELMREGEFREDLFYAINIIPIHVPPLRERREDVPLLVGHFIRKYGREQQVKRLSFSREDLMVLEEYDWPGNVRELENLIERAVVMGSQSNLYLEELARLRRDRASESRIKKIQVSERKVSYPLDLPLAELEKSHILAVLEDCAYNQKQAADVLGINPSTLWRKLKSYGISK